MSTAWPVSTVPASPPCSYRVPHSPHLACLRRTSLPDLTETTRRRAPMASQFSRIIVTELVPTPSGGNATYERRQLPLHPLPGCAHRALSAQRLSADGRRAVHRRPAGASGQLPHEAAVARIATGREGVHLGQTPSPWRHSGPVQRGQRQHGHARAGTASRFSDLHEARTSRHAENGTTRHPLYLLRDQPGRRRPAAARPGVSSTARRSVDSRDALEER